MTNRKGDQVRPAASESKFLSLPYSHDLVQIKKRQIGINRKQETMRSGPSLGIMM